MVMGNQIYINNLLFITSIRPHLPGCLPGQPTPAEVGAVLRVWSVVRAREEQRRQRGPAAGGLPVRRGGQRGQAEQLYLP